jgi:type IV pilus assembly protein PilE
MTLVELMVVVLIISVLAAIAVPGYRSHVVKTQRGAAKACLAQYVQLLERYYTTRLTYVGAGALDAPGCADEGDMPANYTFTLVGAPTALGFTAQAVPSDTFAARDTQCGTLTLNQAGERGVSSGTLANCW